MNKKVAIVVLNFKVKDLTLKCIESVKKSTYEDLEILVVDNNSEDGLGSALKIYQDLTFIQNKENLGYTGGNNIGIKIALMGGADFILILNPDTEIDKYCISNLVIAAGDFKFDIAGPKIYFKTEKKIWYAGGIFDKANVIGKHRGVDELDKGQYDEPKSSDFVSGAAFFARAEVFKKIGLFDERFFLYYEDSEFCLRAKRKGLKIMYIPQSVVYHENAASAGLGSALQDYYQTRNRMLFASIYLPIRTRLALFRESLRNLGNPARRLALFDFLIGNFGKGSYH